MWIMDHPGISDWRRVQSVLVKLSLPQVVTVMGASSKQVNYSEGALHQNNTKQNLMMS